MTTTLVLGAYGLFGSALCDVLTAHGHTVLRQGRRDSAQICVDPTSSRALHEVVVEHRVGTIVNLVAATNVDACEREPQQAYRANVQVVDALGGMMPYASGRALPHLVHISTDQVYDGAGPHRENVVAPCNVYGLSKLAGEYAAAQLGATILRTNFIGRSRCSGRTSLTDWLVGSLRAGQRITVFEDVLFSALHTGTLCKAIALVAEQRVSGTFNLSCCDGNSKAYLAQRLAVRLGLDQALMTIGTSNGGQLHARRPTDMRLDPSAFARIFGFAAPSFDSQIELVAEEY